MKHYEHILLAIDFTSHADVLVARACEMAIQNSSNISVVHVLDNIPMPDTPYGTVISLSEPSDNALLEQEKARFHNVCLAMNLPQNQQWLIWGVPRNEIIALAKQEKVDLIIVGSHGRHGLAALLGSTVNDVLHYAPCDVLAVHLEKTEIT